MKKKEEYNYFEEFIKNVGYILKSVEILQSTVKDYTKVSLEKNLAEMHKLENEADKNLHNMKNYLIKDFLPPIDREDIVLIGHKLDDLEDNIDEILINLNIYNIENIKEEMIEFVNLLSKCTNVLEKCFLELKKSRKLEGLKGSIIEINRLEEQGDIIFEKAMKRLYKEEKKAIEVMKWTELFKDLEDTIDTCEHIADSIEDIIMRNS